MTTASERNRAKIIAELWRRARQWPWDGRGETFSPERHAAGFDPIVDHDAPMVRAIFTQDHGAHASGWWRNSEYERCFHLSLSHAKSNAQPTGEGEKLTRAELEAWAAAFFTTNVRWLWLEPGYEHKDVTHLRLFVDPDGTPILPKGEVYTLVPFSDGSSPEKIYRT